MERKLTLSMTALIGMALFTFSVCPQDKGNGRANSLEVEIRAAIKELLDGYAKLDAEGLAARFASGGFFYHSRSGFATTEQSIAELRAGFSALLQRSMKYKFDIEDLRVVPLRDDVAVANYTVVNNIERDGQKEVFRERTTNVLVITNGRWQVFADHTSTIPKVSADGPLVSGMPVGWERGPKDSIGGYELTVDHKVHHRGRASAQIRFTCGNEGEFGSLTQSVDAADFAGKRIRFSGWLRSERAFSAGLWMRIDGDEQTLGFDNMDDRAVRGTTPWRSYFVVLDVPPNAVNINFGALLVRNGAIWIDDLAIQVVGSDVPSTNLLSAEQIKLRNPNRPPIRSERKRPVNMDFESGRVP